MARLAGCRHIIANAPDPVSFPTRRQIVQATTRSPSSRFRQAEVLEQSSPLHQPEETREFTAALREWSNGCHANVVLNPRSARRVIPEPERLRLRDPDGRAIGVIGILRDMRELDKARAYAESSSRTPRPSSSDSKGRSCRLTTRCRRSGLPPDELLEQSLSRFISPRRPRVHRRPPRGRRPGVTRNAA